MTATIKTMAGGAEAQFASGAAAFVGELIAISADAIIAIDAAHTIVLFNRGAEEIFGYEASEVIGGPLGLLLPEAARAHHSAHLNRFLQDEVATRWMGERGGVHGRRKSGAVFPAEVSISHFKIDGRTHYAAVLRDATERQMFEAALKEKVDAATRDLKLEIQRREDSQAQLVRTQRMEAFGQLTGGIAHDFNNLLTVIVGNLELLEMRIEDDKAIELLQRAHEAAEMGSRLTSRLLTFARKRRYNQTAIDLNEQVIGLVELLERTLGAPVTLSTDLERVPWTVVADASEIENAILNLALNARDAMPNGGRLLMETRNVTVGANDFATEGKLPVGDYVRLSITDSGHGMSPEVQQKAFEPFFTTKAPGKGTGLGLSSIYGFAQQANGAVTLYSEVGRGTTVNIYLPRSSEHGKPSNGAVSEAAPSLMLSARVLLVEDNPEVLRTARGQLESLGCTVLEAQNGPDAVTILATTPDIDIVLSDVVMAGGMSGFDVARWVRENAPHCRVLLASGYPDEVLRGERTDEQIVEILHKPFNRVQLSAALHRAIRTE